MIIKLSKKEVENIRFALMNEMMKREKHQHRYYKILLSSLKKIDKQLRGGENDRTN